MKDLQTVLDALIALTEHACACNEATGEIWGDGVTAIAIVKEMMQAEPVAFLDQDGTVYMQVEKLLPTDTPLYTAPQAVPAGFVLMPVEPTEAMINAGRTTPMPSDSEFDENEDYRAVYKAMLAAAPKGAV